MEPRDDDNLDRLLAGHFDRAAEGQLGRAESAFRRRQPAQISRSPRRLRHWLMGSSLAAAAAVGIVLLGPLFVPSRPHPAPKNVIADQSPAASNPKNVECTYYWRTVDDGVRLAANDIPVRKLRRQQIQQLSWTDDDGKTQLQMTVPHEQIVFVECPTY
ncbi:MAG TPA: hypothetical protein VHS31_07165 [Tepidisphaeraceae bacterium]|jgi:hypothetical protein|nr:hypothetical protein [Tepidisphaeraceae bacterium]